MPYPRDAETFEYQPDPGDAVPFGCDFGVLGGGVAINAATIVLVTDAEDFGVRVLTGVRAPALASGGMIVVFWIGVDLALRGNPAFDGMGLEVGVTIRCSTVGVPPQDFDRTMLLTVRNR